MPVYLHHNLARYPLSVFFNRHTSSNNGKIRLPYTLSLALLQLLQIAVNLSTVYTSLLSLRKICFEANFYPKSNQSNLFSFVIFFAVISYVKKLLFSFAVFVFIIINADFRLLYIIFKILEH